MKLNQNHIEINFFDFNVPHDEITSHLDLQPTHFWVKGEKYNKNYWGYEVKNESNEGIDELVSRFIYEIIVPRTNKIKELTDKFHGEFSVVQYLYDSRNPGFYLNKGQIKILNDCGLDLNLTFMSWRATK